MSDVPVLQRTTAPLSAVAQYEAGDHVYDGADCTIGASSARASLLVPDVAGPLPLACGKRAYDGVYRFALDALSRVCSQIFRLKLRSRVLQDICVSLLPRSVLRSFGRSAQSSK